MFSTPDTSDLYFASYRFVSEFQEAVESELAIAVTLPVSHDASELPTVIAACTVTLIPDSAAASTFPYLSATNTGKTCSTPAVANRVAPPSAVEVAAIAFPADAIKVNVVSAAT